MIAKMNKLSFLIYHKEYETFLEKLRELGVVHVEVRQSGEVDPAMHELLQKHSSYKALYKEMTIAASSATATATDSQSKTIEQVIEEYHTEQNKLQDLNRQLPILDKDIAQMETWGDFDWKVIDNLKANGWLVQFFSCPERSFDEEWCDTFHAIPIAKKTGHCFFITVNGEEVYPEAEKVRLPEQSLSELIQNRLALVNGIEEQKNNISQFCAANLPIVKSAMDELSGNIDLLRVKLGGEKMADGSLMMLEGWVPVENEAEVRAMLEASSVYYEERAALKEDNAPIKLKNNFITRSFETLTKMYGMPEYGEFDPTPLLAPFYALFFGMCVGDAGYGLLLVLLGLYLKKKVSPSMGGLMNLLITLGAATTIVGALLGTFFGYELVKLDLPEAFTQLIITGKFDGTTYDKTMVLAIVVGAIHICFAMLVKGICATARYGFKNSLSEWGWFVVIVGSVVLGTMFYFQQVTMDQLMTGLAVIGGIGAIGIYLLNNLKRNVFVNVGAGLWDTYNMATGLAGDLLSYLRLYALGLAGGMLGGVFNTLGMQLRDSLGDTLFGIPGWIGFGLIFVGGHTLNIALSCLSGYVHSIRLTFVEYFKNSGYVGKGAMYRPFTTLKEEE